MADLFSLGGFEIPPEMIRPSEPPKPAPAEQTPAEPAPAPVQETPAPAADPFAGLGGFDIPADAIKPAEPVQEAPAPATDPFAGLGGFDIPADAIKPAEPVQEAPAPEAPAPVEMPFSGLGGFDIPADAIKPAEPVQEAPAPAEEPALVEMPFSGLGGFDIPADAIKPADPVQEAPVPAEEPAPVEMPFSGLGGFDIPADAIKPAEPVQEAPAPAEEPAPAPAETAPEPTVLLKKEAPAPEPASLTPEEPEELDDDLFAAPADTERHSMFEDMQISFAAPEAPSPAPAPAETIRPAAATVDDDEFTAPAAAPTGSVCAPLFGAAEKNIEIYDPEELVAQLPAELNYCTVLRNPDDKHRDAAWAEACGKLYPASADQMLAAVRACVAEKESVFSGPKVILINKGWTTSEILGVPEIQNYLRQSAKPIWDETLAMCEGTEPAEWVRNVWLMRLVERAVDYFTISSN